MQRDEPTLAEPIDETLLRAGFATIPDFADVLVANLHAPHPRHRVLALRGVVRQSLVTPPMWLDALGDDDAEVRRETLGLAAYASIEEVGIFSAVRGLLHDSDPLVVDAAVFALAEHLRVDAVDELCAIASGHDDARCRESAVAALGAIGDDRGRAAILGALDDKPPVRRRAIVALSNFEGPEIDAALKRASEDRDWQVRSAVSQLRNDD